MDYRIKVDTLQLILIQVALSLLLTHLNKAQAHSKKGLSGFTIEGIQELIEETVLLKQKLNPLSV